MLAMSLPGEKLSEGFAMATAGIAKVWPTFPAATLLSPALGLPHGHLPLGIPLPVIGMVLLGCSVTVLINGLPAARSGDLGLNPTCLGVPLPGFEIFTGSSKVFIGGARAARMFDITKHCWPPAPRWSPKAGLATTLTKAGQAVMKGQQAIGYVGLGVQALGVAADAVDSTKASDAAMAEAHSLAAKTGAGQLAMDVAAMVMGNLIGKNPCIGPPTGAIMLGAPNVLIGGFPVPNLMSMIGRKLASAELPPTKTKKPKVGCTEC
jgi:uncharacterized Zn-binding protein involved in type VI secretion